MDILKRKLMLNVFLNRKLVTALSSECVIATYRIVYNSKMSLFEELIPTDQPQYILGTNNCFRGKCLRYLGN